MAENGNSNKLNLKVILYTFITVICGAGLIFCVGTMIRDYQVQKAAEKQFEEMAQNVIVTEAPTEAITEIPTETETEAPSIIEERGIEVPKLALDWADMREQNDDIYSWIYIPNTNVNYPVLQHDTEHDFYLDHNLDKSEGRPGCIYSQRYNTTTYMDRNTVLYGHNMKNGSMFKTLHLFEDRAFFDENRYFYIYTPSLVLVYEIIAACEYSNEHVLYKYDFNTEEAAGEFIEDMAKGSESKNHVLEDLTFDANTKLVTLSTCIGGRATERWVVVGQLLGEVPVNYEEILAESTENAGE